MCLRDLIFFIAMVIIAIAGLGLIMPVRREMNEKKALLKELQLQNAALEKEIAELKKENRTIILVEHKIDMIAEYCDEIIVMEDGTVAYSGTTKEVLSNAEIMQHGAVIPEVAKFGHAMAAAGKPLGDIPVTMNEAIRLVKERGLG